ncbi:MAG: hypothetical protein HON76_14005 [Candidatus Scalindua sp.]|nr:hypothetical protein [Candidatus Scalindua sp.]MBT5304168.1 hypothetical protein [Candidatus Scalindua sp.]MBT6229155.1 hypothetical protein [Candidatus Scalindua sp.]MBT6563632.1 hypothetical protein [Candidatus Scalindua sp.]MBT7213479.1 hypothetical protein [Candidatus Scalindua sp.]
MKKLLIICTFMLTFFFSGTVGFSDILKDLDKFQKSLGDWVTQIEELNNRISGLESDKASSEKQAAELNQGLANIENLLSDMDAKVERVANMSSLEGVKEIVKSFEGTLNVFKKRFSKLANRIEDQEVKTAVLERMYKTANKPLDTLMQAIDEQKRVIDKLGEKLGNQEKIILSMKESLQKQTSPDEAYIKGIEKLGARLSILESGYIVQKRELKTEAEKHFAEPDTHHRTAETTEHGAVTSAHHEKTGVAHATTPDAHAVASSEAHHEKAEAKRHVSASTVHHEEPKAHAEKTGLIDIGKGFFVKNIKFESFGSSSQIRGKIVNKSDRDYGMTDFKAQTYDKENIIIGSQGFSLYGFSKDSTKSFEEIIVGVSPKDISKYSIYPTQMPLVSETGESTIKIIEREDAVAIAETKEPAPDNLEDLIFDEKASPETPEGFEGVGNGFYAGNVSFNGFGSSSTVAGNIKNNSENDFYNASFTIKVYSKTYGMITSLDFSVRSINRGDTKAFEEIIAGVQPVDIDRYEIAFKSSY